MELISGHENDIRVGNNGPCVLAGQYAFQRAGLTTYCSDTIQAWTLYTGINNIWNPIAIWYWNPNAKKHMETKDSPYHSNIKIPTRERAIVEYIMFHDYFDEGILIEGLKIYLDENEDLTHLYDVTDMFKLRRDVLDYWLEEARNDCDY